MTDPLLTARVVLAGDAVRSLAELRARGGGDGLRSAATIGPWRTSEEVNLSGLRGRGGAGFRTGRKWLSVLDDLDVPATYEDLRAAGSGLGSAGFIVYDDTADMVAVAWLFAASCTSSPAGVRRLQAPQRGIADTLERLGRGAADDRDVAELGGLLRLVTDQNRCSLPVGLRPSTAGRCHTGARRGVFTPEVQPPTERRT